MSYSKQLKQFLAQAKTNDLKTKHYDSEYLGAKVKVSFGAGNTARIPWISFLKAPNKTSNGIYPVYLYYKDFELLILAYGISETNKPSLNWSIFDKKNIRDYFEENYHQKPARYGASYIFKTYNVNNLPADSVLDSDLKAILQEYKELIRDRTIDIVTTSGAEFSLNSFFESLEKTGLFYSDQLISRFVASLLTKPFVILTGLSGSGKTKLAQAFVQWICQSDSQYKIIPVGADWTNREPLLGYPNALNPEGYVKPDNGALELIMQAMEDPDAPYFMILDEMNLSHVERYFADFLSVMESKEDIPLHEAETERSGVPPSVKIPSNLFIIGTVNIDETTNMFSPKVLDRANTIEFRVTQNEMKDFLRNMKELDMKSLYAKGKGMGKSFLEMASNKSFSTPDADSINGALIQFFGELKKTGAEFGYRSATEILRLVNKLSILDETMTTNEKIDIAIMQKLLPKLHGSRRKLCPILETLGGFCVKQKSNIVKDVFEENDFDYGDESVIYPLSLEKIARMYRGAVDNGFTSFAEA
jgi:5-methylcytosine-specific restriction protein B